MLYQSTSVGFGYGLWRRRCFPEVLRRPPNPVRENDLRPSSRSAGGGILTPFPSAAAFALALGARLTLRGMTLRRNPWTFGVRGSHPHLRYSCQHSHFRCLHKGSRPCFTGLRNAPLPRQEEQEIRDQDDQRPTGVESPAACGLISRIRRCHRSARHRLRYSRDRRAVAQSIPASRRPTPIAIATKRRNSARDRLCRPNPSAMLAQIDFDARRTWSASANCSIRGNPRLARWTSSDSR